jgi:hypothetical protein
MPVGEIGISGVLAGQQLLGRFGSFGSIFSLTPAWMSPKLRVRVISVRRALGSDWLLRLAKLRIT